MIRNRSLRTGAARAAPLLHPFSPGAFGPAGALAALLLCAGVAAAATTPVGPSGVVRPRSKTADATAPARVAATAPARASATAPTTASSTGKLRLRTVDLHIFHRVFADFHDRVDAALDREFRIGDTEYTGKVIRFVPDFDMNLKTGGITTRGQEPRNPAFRIVVKKNGVPQDTSWAFLNMPPHFSRKSLVAFLAVRATFENHPAVVSRDSLARRLLEKEKR